VEFCREYQITIDPEDWPCACISAAVMADRAEMLSNSADEAALGLGFDLLTAPARRGDRKPVVESRIGMINRDLQRQPGGVRKDRDRTDPDPREEAAHDTWSLTRLMIVKALKFNHQPFKNRRLPPGYPPELGMPSPIDLWRWGLSNERTYLHTADPERVRAYLLPSTHGVLTPEGIRIEGLHYIADELDFEALFSRGTHRRRQTMSAGWSRKNRGIAYLRPRGSSPIRLTLAPRDRQFDRMTQEEVERYSAALYVGTKNRIDRDRQRGAYFDSLESVIEQEARERRSSMMALAGSISTDDIRVHRSQERIAVHIGATEQQGASGPNSPGEANVYIPAPRYHEILCPAPQDPGGRHE
jgi:hypothetical protein